MTLNSHIKAGGLLVSRKFHGAVIWWFKRVDSTVLRATSASHGQLIIPIIVCDPKELIWIVKGEFSDASRCRRLFCRANMYAVSNSGILRLYIRAFQLLGIFRTKRQPHVGSSRCRDYLRHTCYKALLLCSCI